MEESLRLKRKYTLPREARKIASIISENDEPMTKEQVKTKVKEIDSAEPDQVSRMVRMLRMTNNVEVKDDRAHYIEKEIECSGGKSDKFKLWEQKAKKENSDNLANIKAESKDQ